jgi:glycosyltransferase involved in cell wall biosynthesis
VVYNSSLLDNQATEGDMMREPARTSEWNGALDAAPRTDSLRAMLDPSMAPLFWRSERIGTPSVWWQHVPFAHWLMLQAMPRMLVELGTHSGVSYTAFCEAVLKGGLTTQCHAVDARGDGHAGQSPETYEEFRRYHDARFREFSTVFRCPFDEAVSRFPDNSVDILHIDGLHAYEAVLYDFQSWLPKLSDRAVVLFHGTNKRGEGYGVWRLWAELSQRYASFEFLHGHGLGVLAVGNRPPKAVAELCVLSDSVEVASVRARFAALGEQLAVETELRIFERDAREQIDAGITAAAHARVELEAARAGAARARRARSEAQAQVEQAKAAAASAAAHAAAIERSTVWQATRPLRLILGRFPRTRRFAHRMLRAGWWTVTFQLPRRLRERRLGRAGTYAQWVLEHDTLNDDDRAAIREHIARLARRPLISIVVPVHNTNEKFLREMIDSVRQQLYPEWELCLADDASTEPHVGRALDEYAALDPRIKVVKRQTNGHVCVATNTALELATGEFVALLDHDDLLSERALYEIAVELDAHPQADVLYSDSDNIDANGQRSAPYFKTDWDPDLMLGHNMVSHLGVYRRSLLEQLGGLRPGLEGSQDYDLMLRAAELVAPERIRHVLAVLYHWRHDGSSPTFSESSLDRCVLAARRAIRHHLERRGTRARVEPAPKTLSFTRVVYPLPERPPLVSVIVPTRDRADLLARCAEGVLNRTDYEPLELIVVDNDSKEPETLELLERLVNDSRVRVVRHGGAFNFAALNNDAVREARGEIVVLLNNDIEVTSSLWLQEMVSHALRPEVGAVGAKLLYPDRRVQHAGVVLGVGHGAGHFFHGADGDGPGYFGFLALTRRVSAVTAACMALRRSTYLEAGGLDETNLPVAFNDVDLCLRLGERGYGVVWTPHAELRHLESASRGADSDGERLARLQRDADYLRQRWRALLDTDPHYNLNCSIKEAYFEPGFPPRRPKPWLPFKKQTAAVSTPATREQTLLGDLNRSSRIVEIGPSYNPIAPKAHGWKTTTVDHATRAALTEKYRGHPGVDVDRIEEVDCVWISGSLADAVPAHLHGTFDAFIASHVIEHTTDLVGFLDTAATLLANTGIVILAVPDKRYCFDYFRPLTTTGDVLDAHAARRSRHTRRNLFNHLAYVVKNDGAGAWGQSPVNELEFFHSIEEAAAAFANASDGAESPYVDSHAWQFTPASFELLLLELARIGETDWLVDQITPATGCEFFVRLRRGGGCATAALTVPELQARRLALLKRILLETREQIDLIL